MDSSTQDLRPARRRSHSARAAAVVVGSGGAGPTATGCTVERALETLVRCFADRDEAAADLVARMALHAGATHHDVAQTVLGELARLRRDGADLLTTSDAELRARRVLCRVGVPAGERRRRVLLFTDRADSLTEAFTVVLQAGDGEVSIAMTADPSPVLALAYEQPWEQVVVDHAALRRSARTARELLQPLLDTTQRAHVVVTTTSFDDPSPAAPGVSWVARDLRQMVTAAGVVLEDPLTQRERDVLGAVADGRSNEQVGRALQLSLSTVKTYLERIHAKLGSVDRASAVAIAIRGGWI